MDARPAHQPGDRVHHPRHPASGSVLVDGACRGEGDHGVAGWERGIGAAKWPEIGGGSPRLERPGTSDRELDGLTERARRQHGLSHLEARRRQLRLAEIAPRRVRDQNRRTHVHHVPEVLRSSRQGAHALSARLDRLVASRAVRLGGRCHYYGGAQHEHRIPPSEERFAHRAQVRAGLCNRRVGGGAEIRCRRYRKGRERYGGKL